MVRERSSAPEVARRAKRSPEVSFGPIVSVSVPYTGPVSSPSSIRNVEAPVRSSPCQIAYWTGAAPRQHGSSEKCRLIHGMPTNLVELLSTHC